MTTEAHATSVAVDRQAPPSRLASIDIFRGLTMTVMILVNELAGIKGLPWWNYHMKANIDFITYVDMVFPSSCSSSVFQCRLRSAVGLSETPPSMRCGYTLRFEPQA
jgi:hypothetical protein